MKFRSTATAIAVLAFACSAVPVHADVTDVDASCHAAISKNIGKYQGSLAKSLASCHKSRSGSKIPATTDCNDAATRDLPANGGKGKRTDDRTKIVTAISTACGSASVALFGQYPRCPAPAASSDDGPPTTGIDSASELATCLLDLSEAMIERIGRPALGAPTTVPPAAVGQCQGAIGKGISKVVKTAAKVRGKCQTDQEKPLTGATLDYSTCGTGAGDPSLKISSAINKLNESISENCGPLSTSQLSELKACGNSAATFLQCAVSSNLTPASNGMAAMMFEFPNDGAGNLNCPEHADVFFKPSYQSSTRMDVGYNGYAHREALADQRQRLSLEGCDADCNCFVELDPGFGNCRCTNNPTIPCDDVPTNLGEQNSAECGGNPCRCYFETPLPINDGGVPLCQVMNFSRALAGGTDAEGSYTLGATIRNEVYNAMSNLRPCPTCVGDPTPNDGVRGGLCKYADEDPPTGSCDVNTAHPDFGPLSLDCLPTDFPISFHTIRPTFTDKTSSITAGISTGTGNCAAGTCHCSACSGDTTIGCSSNADCTPFGAGNCGVNYFGSNPRQNSCTAGVADCMADPLNPGMGKCNEAESYCDGALRADGSGILACSNDATCDAYASICDGGNCGACQPGLPNSQRSCFLPTISATGSGGIGSGEAVSTFCAPITASPVVNTVLGLPGPVRLSLALDSTVYCDDGITPYEQPGGSNCP